MVYQWKGLWKLRSGVYVGRQLDAADIEKLKTGHRLLFRYNKFYTPEGKQPRFVYLIGDKATVDAIAKESSDITSSGSKAMISVEDAYIICRKMLITQSWGKCNLEELLCCCKDELNKRASKTNVELIGK